MLKWVETYSDILLTDTKAKPTTALNWTVLKNKDVVLYIENCGLQYLSVYSLDGEKIEFLSPRDFVDLCSRLFPIPFTPKNIEKLLIGEESSFKASYAIYDAFKYLKDGNQCLQNKIRKI